MGQPKPPQQSASHHTTKQTQQPQQSQQPQPPPRQLQPQPKPQPQPQQPQPPNQQPQPLAKQTPAQITLQFSPPTVPVIQKSASTKEGRTNIHRRINSFDSQNSQSNHRTGSQISQSNQAAGGVDGVVVSGINKVIYTNNPSNNNHSNNNNHNTSNKHRTITTPNIHKDVTIAVPITPMSLFLEELQLNEYQPMLLTDGFRMLTDFQVFLSYDITDYSTK